MSPDIKVGGRHFSPADLALIAEAAGESAEIELTTLQQLIVEVDEDRFVQAKDALREQGLRVLFSASRKCRKTLRIFV